MVSTLRVEGDGALRQKQKCDVIGCTGLGGEGGGVGSVQIIQPFFLIKKIRFAP